MGIENIGNFIVKINHKEIPRKAISIAKWAIIDYFGVSIGGSNERAVNILSQ